MTRQELFDLWVAARELDRVADHAERIGTLAAGIGNGPPSTTDTVENLADDARNVVSDAVSVIIEDTDVDAARRALAARDRVRVETTKLERRLIESSAADAGIMLALQGIRRTAEHGGNIAERGVQRGVREESLPESASWVRDDIRERDTIPDTEVGADE